MIGMCSFSVCGMVWYVFGLWNVHLVCEHVVCSVCKYVCVYAIIVCICVYACVVPGVCVVSLCACLCICVKCVCTYVCGVYVLCIHKDVCFCQCIRWHVSMCVHCDMWMWCPLVYVCLMCQYLCICVYAQVVWCVF